MNHARVLKLDVRRDLLRIGRALHRFMHYPNTQGVLDRCLDLCSPAHAYGGPGLLPSPVPNTTHARIKNKVSVVLHEYKQALVCYWELCRTDETVGLNALLQTLTRYLEFGLEEFDLRGDDAIGYYLLQRGERDYVKSTRARNLTRKMRAASKVPRPEPPAIGVPPVLGDVPAAEVRDKDRGSDGPADDRDE